MQKEGIKLPELNPLLHLYKSQNSNEGQPVWTLHNPVSNSYFQIGWAEFECLARFHKVSTADELKELVETETSLSISLDEIDQLITFLKQNGLVALKDQDAIPEKKNAKPFLKRILHGYLFFTIPLVKPDRFLKKTLPYVRPLLSKGFVSAMMVLLTLGAIMTLQRADEFLATFSQMLSWEGVITLALTFAGIKVVHELAHAYTAVKYGVPVPHMGVAFIVMYPILYTETTGGWRLSSRRQRLHIGMAGILAELSLAAIFLQVWHFSPYGSAAQSIAFSVVAISLAGSLLVNLNPLMRFDGYYMLSDLSGIDNLQQRACHFARWKLREVLFGLGDPVPEYFSDARQKFLVVFSFALLTYRFFLFLGIALLVYFIFFKPLGLFLMIIELLWFIGLPVWSEIKIWITRRRDIAQTRRSKVTAAIAAALLIFMIVPIPRNIHMPAVIHAAEFRNVYAPVPARVETIRISEGQFADKGMLLMRLSSPELEYDLSRMREKLSELNNKKRLWQVSRNDNDERRSSIEDQIEAIKIQIAGLEEQKKRLSIYAPFDGYVRDLDPGLQRGRYFNPDEVMFRMVNDKRMRVSAYAGENDWPVIEPGMDAVFIPDFSAFETLKLVSVSVDPVDVQNLAWPELASVYGGALPAEAAQEDGKELSPLNSVYAVQLDLKDSDMQNENDIFENASFVHTGTVRLKSPPRSIFVRYINELVSLAQKELSLN